MRLFGDTWRAAHVFETLCVGAAAFLSADYVRSRFPAPEWRWAGALATLVAVGMNSQVVIFGTIGQSYGLSLLLEVAAFRLAVVAVESRGVSRAAATGLLAGAAAGSSMLTAPVGPALAIWLYLGNRAGNTWAKIVAFFAGGALSWLPIAWLYRQGPAQTLFNVIQYQLKYRHKWSGALRQDIGALSSWINSAQGLSLALLALAGLWYLIRHSDWPRERREEIYLSSWLALGLTAELSTAHPTFERYFPADGSLHRTSRGGRTVCGGKPAGRRRSAAACDVHSDVRPHPRTRSRIVRRQRCLRVGRYREDRGKGESSFAPRGHHLGR
ncbi:MAG: hypothetical protein WDO73_11470 [Ignavibacteriota bacterium]